MNSMFFSKRRNIRELLLFEFYSKHLLDNNCANNDKGIFSDFITRVYQEDKGEHLDDAITALSAVFDDLKKTALDKDAVIEIESDFIKKDFKITFEDLTLHHDTDLFVSLADKISVRWKNKIKLSNVALPDTVFEKNWQFYTKYLNLYFDNLLKIDSLIKKTVKAWKSTRITLIDKILLRMSIVELHFFDDIPEKVMMNESIELAKKYSTIKSGHFINGVLNSLITIK